MTITLFHVTLARNLGGIQHAGLLPNQRGSIGGRSYDYHRKDRIFLCPFEGISYWVSKSEEHSQDQFDSMWEDYAFPVVLKVEIKEQPEVDELGSEDSYEECYYVKNRILPKHISLWLPSSEEWIPLPEVTEEMVDDLRNTLMEVDEEEEWECYRASLPSKANPHGESVFHGLDADNAISILTENTFHMSTSSHPVEQQYSGNYPFYISTSRTLSSRYLRDKPIVFVLNLNKLKHRLSSKPVDYWAGVYRTSQESDENTKLTWSETEERFFSNQPEITNFTSYIRYVLIDSTWASSKIRKLIILCKQRGIPVHTRQGSIHTWGGKQELATALPVHKLKKYDLEYDVTRRSLTDHDKGVYTRRYGDRNQYSVNRDLKYALTVCKIPIENWTETVKEWARDQLRCDYMIYGNMDPYFMGHRRSEYSETRRLIGQLQLEAHNQGYKTDVEMLRAKLKQYRTVI